MCVSLSSYADVGEKAQELGLAFPSPSVLVVLPRDFDIAKSKADLLHESSLLELRKLLINAGVNQTQLHVAGPDIRTISEHSADWVSPLFFIGATWYLANDKVLDLLIGVISSHVYERFKGSVGVNTVKVSFVLEKTKSKKTVRLDYSGPPEGVARVLDSIKETMNES